VLRWAAVLAAAAVTLGSASPNQLGPVLHIPEGSTVTLDGSLRQGEWDDALPVNLSDTVTLYLKHAPGSLFLGIRAPERGVGNLLVVRDGEVRVLHSSAALGTAVYEATGDAWRLKSDFIWRCRARDVSSGAVAERSLFLETEGWLATNSYLGTPGEMEYEVRFPGTSLQVLFVYLPVSDPESVLSWPASVSQDVIPGPIPSVAHLNPAQWALVTWEGEEVSAASPCEGAPTGTIAFSSSRSGGSDVYTISADGTGLRQVTASAVQDLEPCWSPDGVRLAYQSRRPAWAIYTISPDGSDEKAVTSRLSWSPSWSPDGLTIAYSTGSSIKRASASGEELEDLVHSCNDCGRPAWSPDGAWLAFHSSTGGNQDLYVLDVRAGTLRQLTKEASRDFLATWSPDGTHLAFASDRDGNLEIYTVRLDGSELARLTRHPADDLLPAWSPSGEWIAFVSERDGNREIYIMRPDGTCVRRVTDDPSDDMYPTWNPL